jgi:phosphohistidine phosphatase
LDFLLEKNGFKNSILGILWILSNSIPGSCLHMKLYLLRHGKADWPNWNKPDDERPLTKEGKKEVAEVAKLLARLKITPVILTSPLPRASQTAEIAARYLNARVRVEPLLRPGFDNARLGKILKTFSGKSLMVVGHEPDFTRTIFQLTGGNTKMSKAGVALIDLETAPLHGVLRWLFPPKFAAE